MIENDFNLTQEKSIEVSHFQRWNELIGNNEFLIIVGDQTEDR